jgi:uncharacterized protein YjiS (DUF1127 family)
MATHVITSQRPDILAGRVQSSSSRRLAELFAGLNRWLEQRSRYRATVSELSALNDDVLADIGVRRGEINDIARRLAASPPL